jgi:unconventional prefoldin RPB5 interactor 1
MATSEQQTMDNVERQRQQLEENVAKLSKALDHWLAWETEYEMLKEELQKANGPSPTDMLKIGRELGGTMVNEKEVRELLGKDTQNPRTANQIIHMISKRIDYVQQNRQTVEKQYEKAEKLLAGMSLLSDAGLENEEGLPIMDIEEELDENENIVSGTVSQPGKAAPQLIDALKKANLHRTDQTDPPAFEAEKKLLAQVTSALPSPSVSASEPTKTAGATSHSTLSPDSAKETVSNSVPVEPTVEAKTSVKKSVSFAEDVHVQTFQKPTVLKDDLKHWNLKPGSKVFELDDEGEVVSKQVVPSDSPEDAELRREMLQYGLSEVSSVVAELEMEEDEGTSDDSDDENDSNESEEEDEYGRSTKSFVTQEYRQQMLELEKRLNARMVENVGPHADVHPLADVADDVRSLRVRNDEQFNELLPDTKELREDVVPKKKGVQFADDLDIADKVTLVAEVASAAPTAKETISDMIIERSGPASQKFAPNPEPKPTKVSRFKSARTSNSQPPPMLPTPPIPKLPTLPTGPVGRTLAANVVENALRPSDVQAPNEFDPIILNREISREHHKMRNKMIQQQGGFKASKEEEEEDPIVELQNGETRKVSRFRAARLKADGL